MNVAVNWKRGEVGGGVGGGAGSLAGGRRPAGSGRIMQDAETAATALRRRNGAARFLVIALGVALFGSRLGLAFGASRVSAVGPAVLALAGWAVWRGDLRFHRVRLALFILLCALVLGSLAVNMVLPDRFQTGSSLSSLLQFLMLTSLLTLRFTEPVGDRTVFRLVNAMLVVIAWAGLLQFLAQFAGVSVFTWRDVLPDGLSFETGYNLRIPIGDTALFKSNGFFLLEPSVFSQFMALGLAIEIVALRRPRVLVLLFAGLLASMSGTGWLVLGSFVVALAFGLGSRGMVLAVATVALLAAGLSGLAFGAPEVFDSFFGRIGEFSAPGSSAHDRFITPFWMLGDVLWRAPWALWSGAGAGASERMASLVYEQTPNTPIKLMVEYGLPATLAYLALLVAGRRPRSQAVVVVPALVMLLFAGSYAQTPPILFPVALIACVATLYSEDQAARNKATRNKAGTAAAAGRRGAVPPAVPGAAGFHLSSFSRERRAP